MLLLITGASGVGKSTVRAVVEPALAPAVEWAELLDLTPLPAVMSRGWRQQRAEMAASPGDRAAGIGARPVAVR